MDLNSLQEGSHPCKWEFHSLQGVFRSPSTYKEVSIRGIDDSTRQGFREASERALGSGLCLVPSYSCELSRSGCPVLAAVGDQPNSLSLGGREGKGEEGREERSGQVSPAATGEELRSPGRRGECCGRQWCSGCEPG